MSKEKLEHIRKMAKENPTVGVTRDKDFDIQLHKKLYDDYPEMFSMAIHYAGSFTPFPERKYVGGQKVMIDWLNFETLEFQVSDFKTVVTEFAKVDPNMQLFLHYKKPGGDLDLDLFPICNHQDLRNMIMHARRTRFIEMYVEHGTTAIGNNYENGETSRPCRKLFDDENVDGNAADLDDNAVDLDDNAVDLDGNAAYLDGNAVGSDGPTKPPGFEGCNVDNAKQHIEVENEEDFPVDESDKVHGVHVDMSKFDRTFSRLHVNWLGKGVESSVGELKVGEEVIGIDFDAYDSGVGSDCDDPVSKRKLQIKEFQNEQKSICDNVMKPPFYLSQSFADREQVKVLVKQHAVETNRNIKFYKNDSLRVRARCYGHVPCAKKQGGRQKPIIKKKVQTEGSKCEGRAKCDILLNNICESFNSKLVKGRDKPIITALEFIREYLMKRIVKVQEVIDTCKGPLTPTATQILETTKKEAEKFNVIWNGENRFQVNGPWNEQVVVDMQNRECSCRKWDLTGIPCKHVVVVLWKMDKFGYDVGEVEDWVHTAYTLQTWQQVYSNKVEPIVGATYWERSNNPMKIPPPKHHTQVGRPKKKRKRSQYDNEPIVKGNKLSKKWGTITCGKCKNKGHNSKSCKGQSSQPTEKRPRKKAAKSKSATQPPSATQASQAGQSSQPTTSRYATLPRKNAVKSKSATQPTSANQPSQSSQPSQSTPKRRQTVLKPVSSPSGVQWIAPNGFAGKPI